MSFVHFTSSGSCVVTLYPVVPFKVGGYEYEDGIKYYGEWNERGQRHGFGHMIFPDMSRYDGSFFKGHFSGLGILQMQDGARCFKKSCSRYEGEFITGWFHGYGVFQRRDGTKYEGEFRGGTVCGYGIVTYNDGRHGFPRNEGLFTHCRLISRKNCELHIFKAQKCAFMARAQFEQQVQKWRIKS